MIGKEQLLGALNKALRLSGADQTLICCHADLNRVTRFHNFRIHQDIEEYDVEIYFKVDLNGRIGVASTNSLKHQDLKRALEEATRIAKVSPKPRVKIKFPSGIPAPAVKAYHSATAEFPFEQRIQNLRRLFETVKKWGLTVAGSFLAGEEEFAVVNSYGDAKHQALTKSALKLIVIDEPASGFSSEISRDVSEIKWGTLLEEAIKKCGQAKNPRPIKLGKYDCLLEPEAVGDILKWLGYIGFGAKQFYEKTSFLSGRIGEKLMSDKLTIFDDGLDSKTMIYPFDFEGTPKKKVMLIEKGEARGVVYDSHYGAIYRRGSTGHAQPPDEVEGPLPLNLVMESGDASMEEMRASMRRGVVVTRFHYINGLLNPAQALMTGLTRDGTSLIKNGRLKKSLKNLRFTESILRAFSNIIAVSRERKLVGDPTQEMETAYAPALLIKDFTFTGITG